MIKKIKSFFKSNPKLKIKAKELSKRIKISDPFEYSLLKETLYKLCQEGFLIKKGKRYSLAEIDEDKLVGTFQIGREGNFGFVILNRSKVSDVFIPEKHFNTAVHGDKVRVQFIPRQRGKNIEGKIVEVVSRGHSEIIGKLQKNKNIYFVIPENRTIHKDIFINKNDLNGAKDGDIVVVGNINWEPDGINPEGSIIEKMGKSGKYSTQISLLARENNFSTTFPARALEELESVETGISDEELSRRKNFRNITTFTIDPEDAKDFDDAISVKKLEKDNYQIGVHIADVGHYVKKGSAVYDEALKRATSVYLVGNVLPMLPHKLSNNLCSLVPGEDRLTFSVIFNINISAKILSYKIEKCVINSDKRFSYEEAQNVIDSESGKYSDELLVLNNIANSLKNKRIEHGSINFIRPEVRFTLDKEGKPVNVELKKVLESHNLVEEFMLLANRTVAAHVQKLENKKQVSFVYRIHDKPEEEKIVEFERFVSSLGYTFNSRARNKSKELQRMLDQIKGTSEESVINEIAIRTMAKAVYSTDNIGHYGLGFKNYTHFTSPIRRFPDLVVHKLIHNYLDNSERELYSSNEIDYICNHSSLQERNAINAERQSVKLKQIEFLEDKIGSEFHGIISGVMHFGLFIEIEENLAEGLVRMRDMEDDYYIHDESQYSLIGRSTGRILRLGDKVKVKLIRIDAEKQEIDFILLDD
jgi:ribonuclease R